MGGLLLGGGRGGSWLGGFGKGTALNAEGGEELGEEGAVGWHRRGGGSGGGNRLFGGRGMTGQRNQADKRFEKVLPA